MLILRAFVMWLLAAGLFYGAFMVLLTPHLRRQAINRRTVKRTTFFLIASVLAALVVGFIFSAEKLI